MAGRSASGITAIKRLQTEASTRAGEWQAGPSVHQTENFAHHVKGIGGVAPPMAGIKRVFGSGAHNGVAFRRSELSPKQPHTPRVGLAGNKNYGAIFPASDSCADYLHLICGIHNRRREHMNGALWNAFVD